MFLDENQNVVGKIFELFCSSLQNLISHSMIGPTEGICWWFLKYCEVFQIQRWDNRLFQCQAILWLKEMNLVLKESQNSQSITNFQPQKITLRCSTSFPSVLHQYIFHWSFIYLCFKFIYWIIWAISQLPDSIFWSSRFLSLFSFDFRTFYPISYFLISSLLHFLNLFVILSSLRHSFMLKSEGFSGYLLIERKDFERDSQKKSKKKIRINVSNFIFF